MVETRDNGEPLGQPYPYPLRPSELVRKPDFLREVEPLPLSQEEKDKLLEFERSFFERAKNLKEISVSDHVIYPEAFTTEKGRRLFTAIYADAGLEDRIQSLAADRGVKLKSIKTKRQVYDAFFDDLLEAVDSEEGFERYRGEGVGFTRLTGSLKQLGGKEGAPVILVGDIARPGQLTTVDIQRVFSEVDLGNIPKQIRVRANRYSSDWAKEEFATAFKQADGDTDSIGNPRRITRIVNIDEVIKRIEGLRKLKLGLKKQEQELGSEEGNLVEAKRILLGLYQRYVNVLIAGQYSTGRVLVAQAGGVMSEGERRALSLIKGIKHQTEAGRFEQDKASRTLERIDHFLKGTGVRIGTDGLFETIPEKLAEYAQARAGELPPKETPEYEKYNSHQVNAEQTKSFSEVILAEYGLADGDAAWSAVVLEKKGTLGVKFKEKGEKLREVRIPRTFERGLVDTLAVLAHEIEGHVLRHANREAGLADGLLLTEELSTGRSSVLSEAAAMRIEEETKQKMVGMGREALPYYYLVLLEKSRGGSFKDCFRIFFEARAKREYAMTLEESLQDERFYREIFEYVYPRTLRIFRKHTPLSDSSGFLPASSQLEYIEQELIVDVLRGRGLGRLLHLSGIDLYSIEELRRLGMLNLTKIREPKLVVARQIWPQIKRGLDEDKNLDEVISSLTLTQP